MGRTKGTYTLTSNIEPKVGAPLDARTVVPLKIDLTANGTFDYPYIGLSVFVREDNKRYTLIGADPTVAASWREEGSGTTTSADHVTYDNTTSELESTNVQDAIDEVVDDLGSAAYKDVPESGNADATQVVMGNDSRLTDSRNANDVYPWAKSVNKPEYTYSEIQNTPTLGTAAAKDYTTSVTEDSNDLVTSGAVYTALENFPTEDTKVTQTATSTNANYEILFSETADNTTRTEGARKASTLRFNPSKGAIMEGNNTVASGNYSHAEGSGTTANDDYTHAEGYNTSAFGLSSHVEGYSSVAAHNYTHAEGFYTCANGINSHTEGEGSVTSGRAAHAEGLESTASGIASHSEGYRGLASGNGAHAEGGYASAGNLGTFATGENSHAEGHLTTASGESSHAEGYSNIASGMFSHTEGYKTKTLGVSSHAEGSNTTAQGHYSHTEGVYTLAGGNHSHAEGNNTSAVGMYSHAAGQGTCAEGVAQTVVGKYNIADDTSLFIVGNGTKSSTRSNALKVDSDGTTTLGVSGTITSGNSQAVTGGAVYDALQALPSDDTWRNIKVNGTEKLGTANTTGAVDFINGTNTTVSFDTTGNKIKIDAVDTTYEEATTNAAGLMSASDKTKLNGIATGAEVNVQSDWNQTTTTADDYIKNKPTLGTAAAKNVPATGNASTTEVVMGSDTRLTDSRPASDVYDWAKAATKPTYTKSEVGLGNVDNTSDATKKTNFTGNIASGNTGFVTGGDAYTALSGKLNTSLKGAANGLAELDSTGKVPSSQLPSYVDDVIEVADYAHLPITGESGKIYVTLDTNLTYRWSGTGYTEISASLALGNTHSTAFYGDWGKTAYDHATETKLSTATASGLYKVAGTAQGHIASLTAVQKSDITALGIPGSDTNTHRPIQVNGTQNLDDNTTPLNLKNGTNITVTADGGNVTIATSAEVNQNAFSNVKVGSTTVAADSKTDTLELVAGSNVTLTPDATNDKITIAATDTNNAVTQTATTTNSDYELLFSATADNTTRTEGARKNSNLKANPSTGKITSEIVKVNKYVSKYITGTGTAGSASGTTYYPSKWSFDLNLTPANGDEITIQIPVAGYSKGVWLSVDNGTTYHPVAKQVGTRLNTEFPVDSIITLVYCPTLACSTYALDGSTGSSSVTSIWLVKNYYDTNTNDAVKQTPTTTNADYEVIFSKNANNTEETSNVRKNSNFLFNPSTGNLQVTQLNGTTIGSSPKFTDTTYTFAGGTNKFTVTPSGGTAQDVAITPSIANNITGSGTSGYLTKFNGTNTITNGPQLGSSTTTYLRNDGNWATPTDTNTHRPIQVNGTEILGNNTTALNLKAGSNVSLTNSSGTVTIAATDTNTTYTFAGGTNSFTVTPSGASAQTVSITVSDSTKLPLTGGSLSGGLEVKGVIAGDSGSTGHGLYGGGGYHNAYNNIILHGDNQTGTSGIAFVSDKTDGTTITNINQPSDRAFIQYHAYGITTATAEATNPTLATSGESGRLVIGIGNDGADQVWLQTPSRTGLIHQVASASYVIPDTNNTTGSVGSATQPVYVDGGAIKGCTYSLNATVPSGAVFTDTTYTFAGGTNQFTVTPAGGSAQTVTVTPSITNNITGSGTSGYIAKFNGANTITNGPAFGSATTTYLRNDGTWATPPNDNTDTKVTQTATTTNANYEVLFSATADNTTRTEGAGKTSTLLYNPNTAKLSGMFGVQATEIGVSANNGTTGGISLYNGVRNNGVEEYGIAFRSTSNMGKHGYVQGDWATYFTMNNTANRGWVFRRYNDNTNVASISNTGNAAFTGSITVGANTGNTSGVRMVYDSTNECMNLEFAS